MEEFTVLMSVYRKEDKWNLRDSIESILNQTMKPIEFLIIKDGGLTEELDGLLDEYSIKYPRIRILSLPENVGLGRALNYGVLHCNTELIARMDSDDISCKDRFKIQIEFLSENPNIDIVGSNIIEFTDALDNIVGERIVPCKTEAILEKAYTRNPMNHMTVVFRKSSIVSAGNYLPMAGFEDYYLWLRMLNRNMKFFNLDEKLVYARVGNDFIKRRSGIRYLLQEVDFQRCIRNENLINNYQFMINIVIRGMSRLIPVGIMKKIYTRYIHAKGN